MANSTKTSDLGDQLQRLSRKRLQSTLDRAARVLADPHANPDEKDVSVLQLQAALEFDPILTLDVIALTRKSQGAFDTGQNAPEDKAGTEDDTIILHDKGFTLYNARRNLAPGNGTLPGVTEDGNIALASMSLLGSEFFTELDSDSGQETFEKRLLGIVEQIESECTTLIPEYDYSSFNIDMKLIRANIDIVRESNKNSSIYDFFAYILALLKWSGVFEGTNKKKEEGDLSTAKKDKEHVRAQLYAFFDAVDVPKDERPALAIVIEIELARVTRPKWVGRLERGGELATLSAPAFLKRVHPDYIGEDGTVENEIIRAVDTELMRAVEVYIATRRARAKKNNTPLTLGDAEGLNFVLARPSASHQAAPVAPQLSKT